MRAFAEVLPAMLGNFDAVVLRGGFDVGEGAVAVGVGDIRDLIEAGQGITGPRW